MEFKMIIYLTVPTYVSVLIPPVYLCLGVPIAGVKKGYYWTLLSNVDVIGNPQEIRWLLNFLGWGENESTWYVGH
jgi:hypothetical protein